MVYFVRRWQGQVRATEEMEPRWFAVKDLPYEEMWEADKRWLPLLLQENSSGARCSLTRTATT